MEGTQAEVEAFDFGQKFAHTSKALATIETHDVSNTGWFPCIFSSDGTISDMYHPETREKLGTGEVGGLYTEARLTAGQYAAPSLAIRFRIRERNYAPTAAVITVPLHRCQRSNFVKGFMPMDGSRKIPQLVNLDSAGVIFAQFQPHMASAVHPNLRDASEDICELFKETMPHIREVPDIPFENDYIRNEALEKLSLEDICAVTKMADLRISDGKQVSQETWEDASQDIPDDASQDIPDDASQDIPDDASQEPTKQVSQGSATPATQEWGNTVTPATQEWGNTATTAEDANSAEQHDEAIDGEVEVSDLSAFNARERSVRFFCLDKDNISAALKACPAYSLSYGEVNETPGQCDAEIGQDDAETAGEAIDLNTDDALLSNAASTIQVTLSAQDVSVQLYMSHKVSDPAYRKALDKIVKWLGKLNSTEDDTTLAIFSQPDKNWAKWFSVLEHTIWMTPFVNVTKHCRNGTYLDLTLGNVPTDLPKPRRPLKACVQFQSDEQRVCTFVVGVSEEIDYVDNIYQKIRDCDYSGYLIANSSTRWKGDKDTVKNYGIPADGTLTHYWAVVKLQEGTSIPQIGEKCSMYFPNTGYVKHGKPTARVTANYVDIIAKTVVRNLDEIELTADNYANNEYPADPENPDDFDEDAWRDAKESHYEERAAEMFFNLITGSSDEPTPSQIEEAMPLAVAVARSLQRTPELTDIEFLDRVREWVSEKAVGGIAPRATETGPEWPARRIPLPAGAVSNVALFTVKAPTQSNWVMGFRKPPMKTTASVFNFPANTSLAKVIKAMGEDTWTLPVDPPVSHHLKLWLRPDITSIQYEGKAIPKMVSIKKDSMAKVW